jgi:hypothetical protein
LKSLRFFPRSGEIDDAPWRHHERPRKIGPSGGFAFAMNGGQPPEPEGRQVLMAGAAVILSGEEKILPLRRESQRLGSIAPWTTE